MNRIFVCMYGYTNDWIMGKIALDIQRETKALGYECRCGEIAEYDGEDICYHMSWNLAVPIKKAKHNSVFYTHLNDTIQETLLTSIKDQFDSFICMSPEDAQFLIELGFDKSKVFGRTLPVRNTYIKPIQIGIFSACYSDGRKNEEWLIDYCKTNKDSKYVIFVFIGRGWDQVVSELETLGCSTEWHNISRKLPYEYQYQQNLLSSLNYYIYMGMDGGAMGTYDAYAQDVPLCVTYDGFHKSLPEIDYTFDNKQSFFSKMDQIISKQVNRIAFFNANNPADYVRWLVEAWNGKISQDVPENHKKCITYKSVVEKKRDQYYSTNMRKVAKLCIWLLNRNKSGRIDNNR